MPRRTTKTATNPIDLTELSVWAPELAETFVVLASDIALVLDEAGVIRNLAQSVEKPLVDASDWVGRNWVDTVSLESRIKVQQMLVDVGATGVARRREVNHPMPAPAEQVSLAYTAIRLGAGGPTLAVGHDLRAQTVMQQRFLAAQAALEQTYWQTREQAAPRAAAAANAPLIGGHAAGLEHRPAAGQPGAANDAVQPLLLALDSLRERIGQEALPVLLRDAKRLIEQHFLQRARERGDRGAGAALPRRAKRRASTRRLAFKGSKQGKP